MKNLSVITNTLSGGKQDKMSKTSVPVLRTSSYQLCRITSTETEAPEFQIFRLRENPVNFYLEGDKLTFTYGENLKAAQSSSLQDLEEAYIFWDCVQKYLANPVLDTTRTPAIQILDCTLLNNLKVYEFSNVTHVRYLYSGEYDIYLSGSAVPRDGKTIWMNRLDARRVLYSNFKQIVQMSKDLGNRSTGIQLKLRSCWYTIHCVVEQSDGSILLHGTSL